MKKLWAILGLPGVIGLLLACGATGGPTGTLGNLPADTGTIALPGTLGSSRDLPQPVAAAPTLEGILSAPADDDQIQEGSPSGELSRVHFEAFFGPQYENPLSLDPWRTPGDDLHLLVKVGAATKENCRGMTDPSCWNWLDPNLLAGVTIRAYVATVKKEGGGDDSMPGLLVPAYFFQDFLLSEATPAGFNLDLSKLKINPRDEITIWLLNKRPENFTTSPSPYQEDITITRGKGYHRLGSIQILGTNVIQVFKP